MIDFPNSPVDGAQFTSGNSSWVWNAATSQWRTALTPNAILDNTVTTAKIVTGAVTPSKLSTGAPTWDANGLLTLAQGQIKFPASQSASSDANTLDDYEEGTWTPVITGSGGGTLLYNYISGVYRKIGSIVYLQFGVNVASRSGGSGEILIDGLPFASIYRGGYQEPSNMMQGGGWANSAYAGNVYMFVMNSSTQMRTRYLNNADSPGDFTNIQAGTYFNGTIVYCAA
jgi:hypothetical protein